MRDDGIIHLLKRLQDDLLLARRHRLEHTSRLLETAILDLNTALHNISDEELRSLSETIDGRCQNGTVPAFRKKRPARPKVTFRQLRQ